MSLQSIFLLLVASSVCSDDLTVFHVNNFDRQLATRAPKFLDIYTNHRDFQKVLNNYYDVTRRPNHRKFQAAPSILHESGIFKSFPRVEKITPADLEDVDLDRIDFHYPSIDFFPDKNYQLESSFGTIVDEDAQKDEKFVFMQSQKVTTEDSDEDNVYHTSRRPKFKTRKYERLNSSYSSPVALTHVQKIPKLTSNLITNNRYEELDMNSTKKAETTKDRIHSILKRYLEKLYSRKYNSTNANNIRPSSYSKLNSDSGSSDDLKSKFLDGNTLTTLKNKTINKINNLFSLFTVVQFNNTQCNATNTAGTYQGICYTAAECTSQGGTCLGNCASGYGVCCVFVGTCGGSASQNCSYFQSPNYPGYYPSDSGVVVPTTTTPAPSNTPDPRLTWFYKNKRGRQSVDTLSCTFNIYKLNSNISKIRIDFLDLELAGPTDGNCTDERLVISGQNSNSQVPVICGYNTGQHVYVDVSSLSGPLQLSVLSATTSSKRFRIRICQFEDSCMEPSSNCLQYYTGVTGVISSFNYDQASMFNRSVPGYFNNLNYAICIRREEGYCSITYTNVVNGMEYPFQLVNVDDAGMPVLAPGQAGADIFNCPDDYIVIGNTRLCGDKFNDGTTNDDFTMNAPVTDTGAGPIVIPVRTDSMVTGLGFKLFYTQNPCITP